MDPKFNINRPKISDEEIKQHQDFDKLVKQFKEQSIKKARGDESWWRDKKIRYSTVIAGITVVCTVTYFSILNTQKQNTATNETVTTPKKEIQKKSTNTTKPFINEPASSLKVNYSVYKIDSKRENTIQHPGGTKIKVPKNAFTDNAGKVINGEVTIEYREFHDAADIIASGIPMNYDSAGIKRHFESAGMFDIKGSQNGQALLINPATKLTIELSSANSGDRFNQYYLDTIARQWNYLKHDNPIALKTNGKQDKSQISALKVAETEKTKYLRQQVEVTIPKQIDSVKTVYQKRVQKLPVPVQPGKPVKQTAGKPTFVIDREQQDFPELASFDNVVFEVGAENKNYSKELHDITWSDVKIGQGPQKGKNYLLTLSYRQRREQLVVYPVLAGADYDKAVAIYSAKLAQYEEKRENRLLEEKRLIDEMNARQAALLEKQRKQEEELKRENEKLRARYDLAAKQELVENFKQLSNQGRAVRIFEVARFGIYNSDCPHPEEGANSLSPVFVLNDKVVRPGLVYLVNHSNNQVMALNKEAGFAFNFESGKVYSLCVFDKNKVYLCNKANFTNAVGAGTKKFNINPLPESADDLPGLKKALEI